MQVRSGMVSGIYRVGGIAALIADADRYVLAAYFQENLKYVKPANRLKFRSISIPARSSLERLTASGGAMAWDSTFRAMRFQNSSRQIRMSRRANTPLKFFLMIPINPSFQ